MDLTISLVEKIYFKPIVDRITERMKMPLRSAQDAEGDVEMGGVDEFGQRRATIRTKQSPKRMLTGLPEWGRYSRDLLLVLPTRR